MHSVGYIAVALISSGVVLTALYASPGSFLHKLLSLRSLVFLGRRSYGFYLYHPVVMALTEPLRVSHSYVNLFAVVALNLSLSLLLTELSYRFLEQPMLRLKARFEPVLLSRPAVV
jgi:peptidoglycan/LPS O-acetylase OafA/YrhL